YGEIQTQKVIKGFTRHLHERSVFFK
ncbi:hypothetical protein CP02DC14_0039B, partial [Chlamydia psittaci 02DC14]